MNAVYKQLKAIEAEEKAAEMRQGAGGGGPPGDRPPKHGRMALGLWHRILTVLLLVYQQTDQMDAADEGSDYRLVVNKRLERALAPKTNNRCDNRLNWQSQAGISVLRATWQHAVGPVLPL